MKKTTNKSAQDDGQTEIHGTTPRDLLWSSAKLLASIGLALLAASWLDTLLSQI